MTVEDAIRHLRLMQGDLNDALAEGLDDLLDLGLDVARQASSGNMSYAEMRRQDHPYATRHGRARQPSYIVNKHTGEFYEGWQKRGLSIINDSEHAKFMRGTSTMVVRDIDDYIAREVRLAAKRMLEYRLRRVV